MTHAPAAILFDGSAIFSANHFQVWPLVLEEKMFLIFLQFVAAMFLTYYICFS